MPVLRTNVSQNRDRSRLEIKMSISLSAGSIPPIYRQLFEMIDGYGIHLITVTVFTSLFESATLSKEILTQVKCSHIYSDSKNTFLHSFGIKL